MLGHTLALLTVAASAALASSSGPAPLSPAALLLARDGKGYADPNDDGGSMFTIVNGTYPPGLGEPLNVIISADSDPEVLVDSTFKGGFQNYMLAAELSTECLGGNFGSKQNASLDASHRNVTQIGVLRQNFGDPYLGSCKETFDGGQHLRYWRQNSTNALFLAVSIEMSLAKQHDIVPNGYNLGRDYLVGNLTGHQIDSRNVTNATVFTGNVTYGNYSYSTEARYVSGLLNASSDGVNHYITVEVDNHPAIDGLVAVLTVKITARPPGVKAAAPGTAGATPAAKRTASVLLLSGVLALGAGWLLL
ncbi:uncharacterized protein LOC62_04G005926 [Vanrija pseudolonga]|uniref:Uncharacterized protein n=1 Tax=Vanrija pseudolonga TaxID=143232 RepID=A0AAF1BJ82_9TREE|nr:hypothetical protein LOC62_04G005926 [Vanrija pseudolonga]